ncbi:VOC family protein [Paenibacillus sp. MMS18-CY102]|uniref:VOC family protein n=1 Tax=Paenibacillus sp. MMS18-CY102 TaxID=2682849 RepID=UPI0013655A31|nr:VOC family protein [Paenibacillus sp. MMS18-CY102]MWC29864.1 VOC family protein [Paenibacillus sp. MMS18-CY102]
MINQFCQIMLYVNDQDQAKRFWTEKVGFVVASEEDNGQGFRYIEIAAVQGAQTSFILHNKQFIAQMQPELNLGTPSIMFFTDDVEGLYQAFKDKEITVGDLVSIPGGRVFNFADDENNYFAVMQKQ